MTPISYVSDQPVDYAAGLERCRTLAHLRDFLKDWRSLCWDAFERSLEMDETAFKHFRKGLADERRGVFAGEEWSDKYSAILLPELLFRVSIVAAQYVVPWGLAYKRMEDVGKVKTTWRIAPDDLAQYRAQVAT